MARSQFWIISVAIVGAGATAVAASLVWLVLTRPVATAEVIARLF
jgi:hypothetical protein